MRDGCHYYLGNTDKDWTRLTVDKFQYAPVRNISSRFPVQFDNKKSNGSLALVIVLDSG